MLLLCKYDKLYYYTLCTFPPFIVGWWNIASTVEEKEEVYIFPVELSLWKCLFCLQRKIEYSIGEERQTSGAPVQEKQCIRMYDGNRNKLVLLGKFILMKGCSLLPGIFRLEQVPVWASIWIDKGAEVMYGSAAPPWRILSLTALLCAVVVWRWYESNAITKNRFHIHLRRVNIQAGRQSRWTEVNIYTCRAEQHSRLRDWCNATPFNGDPWFSQCCLYMNG